MRHHQVLRLLGSFACFVFLGCQPQPGVSSTADRTDGDETQSPEAGTPTSSADSKGPQTDDTEQHDERPSAVAAGSAVQDQQPSGTPTKSTRPVTRGPESDVAPSMETGLPSGARPKSPVVADAPTEVRETFFPNGATKRQWIVKVLPDGTEVDHGESLLWYENGQVHLQGEFVDGVREGLWLSWHKDGKKRGEGSLHRNRRVGTWIMWHENGQKRSEVAYDQGLAHGRATVWDDEGNIIESGEYVRKKKHGTWITRVDGQQIETKWVNGVEVE